MTKKGKIAYFFHMSVFNDDFLKEMHSQLYNDHFEFYTVLLYPVDTLNVVLGTSEGPQALEIQKFASEVYILFVQSLHSKGSL